MNDNPGGTPSPLNPNPAQVPNPMPSQAANTTQINQATGASSASQADVTNQAATVDSVSQATATPAVNQTATTDSNQIAMKPAKKSKVGLIIGIILGIAVLAGGIAAAVFFLPGLFNNDPVGAAMQRIMSGTAPKNVAVDGDFNILINQSGSPIKRINIDLDTDVVTGSMINTSSAVLTITDSNNKDYSVKFNEVYTADGNIYFKVDGASSALEGFSSMLPISDSFGIVTVLGSLEGTWFRVSADTIKSLGESASGETESPISCVANLVSTLDKSGKTTADLYSKNPFITSTTENVFIPRKQSQVYRINIDSDNFVNFVNSINNSGITNDIYTCLGYENSVSLDKNSISKLVETLPKVYAEVNGNNDFSRLYLESDLAEGAATITIDLGFTYPSAVNVNEPVEYTDFSELITQMMSGFYNMPEVESEVIDIDMDMDMDTDTDMDW